LRRPLTWSFVIVAGLVALATTFSYLGGFLDPDGNARNMPLALVNEDRGATVGGQPINFGDQVIDTVAAPNPRLGDAVRWTVLPSRRAALAEIGRDEYLAALVVPADFSERVLAIGEASSAAPVPATVEVLTNPASGTYAGTFSQTVATTAAGQVSDATSRRLSDFLTGSGATLTPAAARVLGQPVQTEVTAAHPIGERAGRGIGPFYFAVVLAVVGVLGAVIVSTGVDVVPATPTSSGADCRATSRPWGRVRPRGSSSSPRRQRRCSPGGSSPGWPPASWGCRAGRSGSSACSPCSV